MRVAHRTLHTQFCMYEHGNARDNELETQANQLEILNIYLFETIQGRIKLVQAKSEALLNNKISGKLEF